LAGVGLAAVVLGAAWFRNHRNDPDVQTVVVDAAVACIPFFASILFALWPEVNRTHIAWRLAIVLGGLLWSLLLGRQDYLNLQASRSDTQAAITTAVGSANKHSDQQIAGLDSKVDESTSSLNKRLDDVAATVSSQVAKSETDITTDIGKVIVPPPKYAELQFTFFDEDQSKFPISSETLTPDANGIFSADFTATNISDTTADEAETWVILCDECAFAGEPSGFDRPVGTVETMRHKKFGNVNPGTSVEKMTIEIKPMRPFSEIRLAFKYSCGTCGRIPPLQSFTIWAAPSLSIAPPTKSN